MAHPTVAAEHTVSVAFVASAVARLTPAARRRVLAECGIAPQVLGTADARVPAAAFGALWLAVADELDDEFFGLDSRRMKVGSFALLCRALLGHGTVGGALREAQRGFNLFFDDVRVELKSDPPRACLLLHNRIQPLALRRFADETLLVMLHGLLCWLAGRRVPLRAGAFAWPRPAHAAEYRRMFGAVLAFDAPTTSIEFDASVLGGRTSPGAASLREFLRDAPQSVFLKQVGVAAWSERVRRRLRRGADWPAAEHVAREWGVSGVTLRRKLAAEGTSWQRVVDGLRHDLAVRLLNDGALSLEQVAESLGYGDARSLHRAFRKWTGAAPGAYRGT
ncbi:MAG TPA: AraC family transcriptional regulator [Burkholderiaceae bacterium]|nr:AraC family transcriptional regulator [Burkholderiaceae bacterium]